MKLNENENNLLTEIFSTFCELNDNAENKEIDFLYKKLIKKNEEVESFFKVQICKMIEKDNFKNGCDPDTTQDHGIIETFQAQNNSEILEKIKSFSYNNELYIFENRIEFQRLENNNGFCVGDNDIEYQDFKNGKIDLWNAMYSVYISEITENEIENEKLKTLFPELKEE